MQVVKQVISQTPVSICIDSLRGSCQNAVLGLSYSLAGSCLLRAGEPGTLGEAGSAPASMLAVGESGESARRGLTREFGRWASTLYIRWEGVACTSKNRFLGSAAGCKFSTDRDTGIASLIPDASFVSLIPIQIGTLHAHVCKFGHQWKYAKFRNYANMQSRKFTGFR